MRLAVKAEFSHYLKSRDIDARWTFVDWKPEDKTANAARLAPMRQA